MEENSHFLQLTQYPWSASHALSFLPNETGSDGGIYAHPHLKRFLALIQVILPFCVLRGMNLVSYCLIMFSTILVSRLLTRILHKHYPYVAKVSA